MTYRVGFLGYRFMGRAHANALARLPMFFPDAPPTERTALVGRDDAALEREADRLGFTVTATELDAILEDIDVLYNLAPNHLHVKPSIEALDTGVHVVCEKPLAASLDGATSMADAATASSARSATAFNYRYVPAVQLAKRMIDSNEIGEVRHFKAQYLQDWLVDPSAPWSWRLDRELAGSGALGDLGSHVLDLARFLVGDITDVSGHLERFVEERPVRSDGSMQPVTVDDTSTAQFRFEHGGLGSLMVSRVCPGHKNDLQFEIHGSTGGLRFSLERMNELSIIDASQRGYERVLATDETDPYLEAWWPPGHVLGWEHTFVHENYEFLTAIEDRSRRIPDFSDGLTVQRILDAIIRSDRSGRWQSVE